MVCGHNLSGIERSESLLLLPGLLPLGFDQVKRILSAAARHRADIIAGKHWPGNAE
jgi:hypothetical protein